jgi:fatty acid-binding protein DegV
LKKRSRIVTDSTADIPDHLVESLEIGVIYDYVAVTPTIGVHVGHEGLGVASVTQ